MFNDEIGGELVKEIPMRAKSPEDPAPKKKQGPVAKARTEVPRLPGESRAVHHPAEMLGMITSSEPKFQIEGIEPYLKVLTSRSERLVDFLDCH